MATRNDSAPDLIIENVDCWTGDSELPRAEAVACGQGRIMAVGTHNEIGGLASSSTRRIGGGGRTLLPGLCDAHIHLLQWALSLKEVNLVGTKSREELLARVRAAVANGAAGEWIIGRGWNESEWPSVRFPVAADLDGTVDDDRPVLLYRSDMHAAVANSEALRRAGIDAGSGDPPGGYIDRDEQRRPTGVLRERAIGLVSRLVPKPGPDDVDAALIEGIQRLNRLGITAIHDQRMGSDTDTSLSAYGRLNRNGRLNLRINCNIAAEDLNFVEGLGLPSGLGDDRLRLGHIKLFSDGSLGSRTAWMLAPYESDVDGGPPGTGLNVTPVEDMAEIFHRAQAAGYPISIHAIGDRAIRTCLDLFEELGEQQEGAVAPHRIEHVQTIDPEDIPRLGAMGITASVQPLHLLDDRRLAERYLGERGATTYAFRSLKRKGALLALGSDAPVADPSPFLGIHAALTRRPWTGTDPSWYPQERLSLDEILRGYTIDAARAGGWQATIGSLRPGKRADAVLLNRNLFDLTQEEIGSGAVASLKPLLTLFDGEVVYEAEGL